MLLGQIADSRRTPRLLPFLVVNSWAIFTSFNVIALFDRGLFKELANRLRYSLLRFHFMNTVGHFLPALLATFWFYNLKDRRGACEWTQVLNLRLASLLFHVLWAFRVGGGLRLDNVYLKRPKEHWYIAWLVAAITHTSVGHLVAQSCV